MPDALPTDVITLHGFTHGGEAVGRLPDGRACFVAGGLPGEEVEVAVRRRHKRHATADLVRVITPSPHRVQPPCPYYDTCGGCQLQHAAPDHQLQLKAQVLREQLQRIGKVADPPVRGVTRPDGAWPGGYRSWARMAVDGEGRLGFRRRRSHEIQPIDRCLLLDDGAQALRDAMGDGWSGATEVTLTAGSQEGIAVADVADAGADAPALPDGDFGLVLRDADGTTDVRQPRRVRMVVDDLELQTSAGTFFQAGPPAAALLVRTVLAVLDLRPGDRVLDLYAGVGLFSAALAGRGVTVTAVEANALATADARTNTAGLPVDVVTSDTGAALSRMRADDVDLVVLDPPRTGARAEVCHQITWLRPRQIVYVACDPAALARDTLTLVGDGYQLVSVDGLDLFGHTAHIEAVALFEPVG